MPFAENGQIQINYHVEGSGEPLVLLHGFLNDHLIWQELGYTRSLKDFKLILIDLRGYGNSDKPHDPDKYYLPHRVKDVTAVLDALKIQKAHIFGYSLGGRICFGMAKYAPERVKSFIIGGMSPFGYMDYGLEGRLAMLESGMESIVEDYESKYGRLPDGIKKRILANDNLALAADTRETMVWKGIGEATLSSIKVSVLYYCGDLDTFYGQALRASKIIPKCTFVTLEDANHQRAYVRKSLIIQHILSFLDQLSNHLN